MNYIYSSLSNDQDFPIYVPGTNGINEIAKFIKIRGDKDISHDGVYTSKGAVSEVSDDDLAILKEIFVFQHFVKEGFFQVEKKEARKVENVTDNMAEDKKSRPRVKKDFDNMSRDKVTFEVTQ